MKREVKGQEKSLRSAHETDIIWKLFPESVTILSTRYICYIKNHTLFSGIDSNVVYSLAIYLEVDVNISM